MVASTAMSRQTNHARFLRRGEPISSIDRQRYHVVVRVSRF